MPTKGKKFQNNYYTGEDTNQIDCPINIQDQTSYTHLKCVRNCKFCGAKRFEYESPAFCCSKGSVHLTSYDIPCELKNLYLSNSKEFRTYIRTYNNIFAFTSLE